MTTPHIQLHTGAKLPAVGLGMWKVDKADCAALIVEAIKSGYRHFDCACDYGNEAEVGEGLQQAIANGLCSREDLWITSKLWNTYHQLDDVPLACKRSLSDLKLDYLDLYLVHFPIAQQYVPFDLRYPPGWFEDPDADEPQMVPAKIPLSETWHGMEDLRESGIVKNIGVCNFGVSLLRDMLNYADDAPSVLQIESHPYLVQEKLLRFCNEHGIAVTAFSPLGALSYHAIGMADASDSLLELPSVQAIASAHGRTPAQVILRWGVQRGTSIVPKTSSPARLRENIAIFDFELTADEMQTISNLNQHRRYNDPGDFCEAAFNTFFPIYE